MGDVLAQALRELGADRFRTRLSLLGVAVGIFSIVSALTLVDSVQKSVREGFSVYGGDILFVDRMPLEPDLDEDGRFKWWEYATRPEVSWREYRYLMERGQGTAFSQAAFVRYGSSRVGVTGHWPLLVRQPLAAGRSFTEQELTGRAPVVMIGSEVETTGGRKPVVGEALWIEGTRYEIIGIFEKAGANSVCTVDIDQVRLVPEKTLQEAARSSILLSGADEQQVRTLLRECRRLTPQQRDNFALNRLSFLLQEINSVFSLLARMGWIIGAFSLLVGGFGIANMMYVSVEERKSQIGICRALGARRRVIVRQFLGEAAMLSLLGGAVERIRDVFGFVRVGAERDLHAGVESGAQERQGRVNLVGGHTEPRGVQLQANALRGGFPVDRGHAADGGFVVRGAEPEFLRQVGVREYVEPAELDERLQVVQVDVPDGVDAEAWPFVEFAGIVEREVADVVDGAEQIVEFAADRGEHVEHLVHAARHVVEFGGGEDFYWAASGFLPERTDDLEITRQIGRGHAEFGVVSGRRGEMVGDAEVREPGGLRGGKVFVREPGGVFAERGVRVEIGPAGNDWRRGVHRPGFPSESDEPSP